MILFDFFLFLVKPLIVGTRSNRLSEVSVRTRTHNLCFRAEIMNTPANPTFSS